ncbi:pyridoxal-phosphate dependent enzyme [Thermococcus argininiproducens]|uniref:Pyridoxal-phosphate dependent enzyme n=1 Tax=Thermococcus argininiproducens TaxID=2866384 RepID=A0A9E7M942_9EURY|nr:pyridoxal-phosphate dependent enzyme [Thermococcus argininiproducens]USG99398.1 pyridoxal-phosphate dependent enzyme [Thermococcus argininiproducens]
MIKCPKCGREYTSLLPPKCSCGTPLEIRYDYSKVKINKWKSREKGVWKYKELLPPVEKVISLKEGGTPLVRAKLGEKVGLEVFIKDETRNPTGSFRDRLATVGVSYGLPWSNNGFIVASDGNAAASLAAYAARANKEAFVVVPKKVDRGKLIQMIAFGAKIIRYGDSVDECIEYASELSRLNGLYDITPENNIIGVEGQKTLAFELWEEVNPTHVIVPTGSGSNIYSIYKGFKELLEIGVIEEFPKLIAVQTENCSPIAAEIIDIPAKRDFTKALGLYVKDPINKELAINAIKESKGTAVVIREDELDLGERVLAKEGVFAEYSSAVVIPALLKLHEGGYFEKDDKIALVITGSGLKSYYVEEKERFSIGGTKLNILKLLREKPMYGYEVWENLEKPIKYQAVYQHVKELESLGLIEEAYKRGRRTYYRLTEKGQRLLENFEE